MFIRARPPRAAFLCRWGRALTRLHDALALWARWGSNRDHPGVDVVEHAGTRADHRTFADGHARSDEHVCADPRVVTDANGSIPTGPARARVVMGRGAKERVLGYGGVPPDFDPRDAIAIDVVAERSVVAHDKIPRCPNAHG